MIALDPFDQTCALCGAVAKYQAFAGRTPESLYWNGGLDDRPSYGDDLAYDAEVLAHYPPIFECASCGHVAAHSVAIRYPRIEEAAELRSEIMTYTENTPLALRYLAVATVYGAEDPGAEGRFVLRAAWADEAAGRAEPARGLRRRAGLLLEDEL
jgi:hypothetical protein